jgi:hypothetical protein
MWIKERIWRQPGRQIWSQVCSLVNIQMGNQVRIPVRNRVWAQFGKGHGPVLDNEIGNQVAFQAREEIDADRR